MPGWELLSQRVPGRPVQINTKFQNVAHGFRFT